MKLRGHTDNVKTILISPDGTEVIQIMCMNMLLGRQGSIAVGLLLLQMYR